MSFNLQSLTNLNPFNAIIDAVGDMVGLPPEAKAIAKVGIGFVTSNPVVILDGVLELGEAAAKTAKTEWKAPADAARASDGYAKGGGSQEQVSGKVSAPRGRQTECDVAEGGGYGAGPSGTPGASAASGTSGASTSQLSAKEAEFYRHARTVFDNFDKMETAGWLKLRDGQLWPQDLQAIIANPDVPSAVRQAADYFLKNADSYRRICSGGYVVDRAKLGAAVIEGEKKGAYGTGSTGAVRIGDGSLGEAIRNRGISMGPPPGAGQPVQGRPPAGVAVGGCRPQGNPVRDILNDPSLSPNEKLEAILFSIADAADDEALDIAQQISNLQDKQAGLDKSSKEGQQAAAEAQQDIDRLSQRLQKLMERRTQMMQLISNINKAMHENAMLCISNLR